MKKITSRKNIVILITIVIILVFAVCLFGKQQYLNSISINVNDFKTEDMILPQECRINRSIDIEQKYLNSEQIEDCKDTMDSFSKVVMNKLDHNLKNKYSNLKITDYYFNKINIDIWLNVVNLNNNEHNKNLENELKNSNFKKDILNLSKTIKQSGGYDVCINIYDNTGKVKILSVISDDFDNKIINEY